MRVLWIYICGWFDEKIRRPLEERERFRKERYREVYVSNRVHIPGWMLILVLLAISQQMDLSAYPELEGVVHFLAGFTNGVFGLLHKVLKTVLGLFDCKLFSGIIFKPIVALVQWFQSLM